MAEIRNYTVHLSGHVTMAAQSSVAADVDRAAIEVTRG